MGCGELCVRRNVAVPGRAALTGLFDETLARRSSARTCLTAAPAAYKQALVSLLKELAGLEGQCDDRGRLARIPGTGGYVDPGGYHPRREG